MPDSQGIKIPRGTLTLQIANRVSHLVGGFLHFVERILDDLTILRKVIYDVLREVWGNYFSPFRGIAEET